MQATEPTPGAYAIMREVVAYLAGRKGYATVEAALADSPASLRTLGDQLLLCEGSAWAGLAPSHSWDAKSPTPAGEELTRAMQRVLCVLDKDKQLLPLPADRAMRLDALVHEAPEQLGWTSPTDPVTILARHRARVRRERALHAQLRELRAHKEACTAAHAIAARARAEWERRLQVLQAAANNTAELSSILPSVNRWDELANEGAIVPLSEQQLAALTAAASAVQAARRDLRVHKEAEAVHINGVAKAQRELAKCEEEIAQLESIAEKQRQSDAAWRHHIASTVAMASLRAQIERELASIT